MKRIFSSEEVCKLLIKEMGYTDGEYDVNWHIRQNANLNQIEIIFDPEETPQPKVSEWKIGLMEKLADIEHQRWADWQKYVFSVCIEDDNCVLFIPNWARDKWNSQIMTPYKDLSEKEKESDREQVRRYLPIIQTLLDSQKKELVEMCEELKIDLDKYGELLDKGRGILNETEKVLKLNEDCGYNKALSEVINLIKSK
jgi:hypothetical protein